MRALSNFLVWVIALILLQDSNGNCQTNPNDFPLLKGLYFGQSTPGDTAKIFAKDLISVKGRYEFGVTFSPAGTELLIGTQDKDTSYIIYTRETSAGWTKPKRISLSNGMFSSEMEPFFTPDGKQIYFAPFNQWDGIRLWGVDITTEGWKDPKILNEIVASFPAFYPNCSMNKTLYYSNIPDRKIYRAKYSDGKYNTPELAGLPFGFHCFISPDEGFALRDGVPDGIGKSDIYIVFRNSEGQWKEPIKLGPQINSEFSETCPALSNDGKYMFFSRYNEENEVSDIYWASAKFIEELRPNEKENLIKRSE